MKLIATEVINWYSGKPEKDGWYICKFNIDGSFTLRYCRWDLHNECWLNECDDIISTEYLDSFSQVIL